MNLFREFWTELSPEGKITYIYLAFVASAAAWWGMSGAFLWPIGWVIFALTTMAFYKDLTSSAEDAEEAAEEAEADAEKVAADPAFEESEEAEAHPGELNEFDARAFAALRHADEEVRPNLDV